MERITSLSNARAQGMEKVQALEAELSKLTNEKAALEVKERKNAEEANQVWFMFYNDLYSHSLIL